MEAGSQRVNNSLDSMGRKAKETTGAFEVLEKKMHGFSGLMGTIMGAAVGAAVGEFIHMLDVTQKMDNMLKLVTTSSQDFLQVQNALFEVAVRSRGSYEATVEMYRQMQQATLGMGYSQHALIGISETLNKALALTSTNGMRAKMGLMQLAEGLDLGTLRGNHLRSMITDMPGVAMALAKGLSDVNGRGTVTIGMLMRLGAEGGLTANVVMEALGRAAPWVQEQFAKTTPTISQAFQVLETKIMQFITNFNHASGIGTIFANSLLFISNHLNAVIGLVGGLAAVITGKLVLAFYDMAVAMAATPLGAIMLVVGALTAALGYLSDQTFKFGNTTATGFQVAKAAVMTAWQAFKQFWDGFKALFSEYYAYISNFVTSTGASLRTWFSHWGVTIGSVWDLVMGFFNILVGTTLASFKTIAIALGTLPAIWQVCWGSIYNIVITAVEGLVNFAVKGLGYIGDAVSVFTGGDYGDKIRESLSIHPEKMDIDTAAKQIVGSAKAIGGAWKDAFTTDYIGNFGSAFKKNLDGVVAADKAAAGSTDELTQVLGGNTKAMEDNKKGHDKLAKAREAFQNELEKENEKILSANGKATVAVQRWYDDQIEKLNKLGLAHTQYADMLDFIFNHKMLEARIKDVENTEAWAKGLLDVQKGVAGKINDEWNSMRDATGNALAGVEAWYTQQKRLLTAAGLDHTVFATQAEDVYHNRLTKARSEDVKNSEAWAAGLNESQRNVVSGYVSAYNKIRESTGGAVAVLTEMHQREIEEAKATHVYTEQWAAVMEATYADKLPAARDKDIQSMLGWSRALTASQLAAANGSGLESLRQMSETVKGVQAAMDAGVLTTTEYATQMRELGLATLETKINMGEGSWADSMLVGIGKVLQGFTSIKASITDLTSNALKSMVDGFANSIGHSIVYATNLKTALYDVARQALAAIISGLVKMAIQWALNATIGHAIAAATTAASAAQATALASAWAPAAAMASLATSGANSAPAMAGITATTALAMGLAHAKGFAQGGPVSGPGSGTSDSIFAKLSNGEFVVNAKATADNFQLLQAINNGRMPKMASGGVVDMSGMAVQPVVPLSVGGGGSQRDSGGRNLDGSNSLPQSAPTEVKVRVMNFTDPKEALRQLDTADGEQVVMNIMHRNAQTLQQIIGRN